MTNTEASDVATSDQQALTASETQLVDKKIDPVPPTARQSLAMGVQIGTLEAIFLLMEFIFGSTIFTSVMRGKLPSIVDFV